MKTLYTYLICISMFFLNTKYGLTQTEMETYVSKTVLDLKWGSGPTEIGFMENVLSSLPGGLSAFDVDENENIYMLDCVNKQVKVFHDGELINSFFVNICLNTPFGMYLALDDQGNVWIHESKCRVFREYTSHGTLIKSILYQGEVNLVPNFRIINGEIIGFNGAIVNVTPLSLNSGIGGEPVYNADVKRYTTEYELKVHFQEYSGRNYFWSNPSERTTPLIHPEVEICEKNGEKNILVFEDIDPLLNAFSLLKEDKEGNLYVIFSAPQQKWMLLIYDNKQKLITKQIINTYSNSTLLYNNAVIDMIGNIFFINTDDTGIRIIKWHKI